MITGQTVTVVSDFRRHAGETGTIKTYNDHTQMASVLLESGEQDAFPYHALNAHGLQPGDDDDAES